MWIAQIAFQAQGTLLPGALHDVEIEPKPLKTEMCLR
jgi:hypothetical protein